MFSDLSKHTFKHDVSSLVRSALISGAGEQQYLGNFCNFSQTKKDESQIFILKTLYILRLVWEVLL